MEEPILLLNIEDDGKCTLNPDALEFLESITEPTCVISVAGKYRTGKSYLLNRILKRQQGFEIGPSVQPCTRGIWIWGEAPFISLKKRLILIDTEGLFSFKRDETTDMTIFSLSVLLSSVFIYNSLGVIDETAIENLSLVCKLTENIHLRAHQGTPSPESYAEYFPKFIWVLRDVSLQSVDEHGNELTANEYLEYQLRPLEGHSAEVQQKNQTRKILKSFFQTRECFAFVRPLVDEEQLKNIETVPYEDLAKEFRHSMENFIENLNENPKVKKIDGILLNGKMLSSLLQNYVEAINNKAIPTISTAWERTLSSQLREVYTTAFALYRTEIQIEVEHNFPMEENELRELEQEKRNISMAKLKASPTTGALYSERDKYIDKLQKKCNEILAQVMAENQRQSHILALQSIKGHFEELENKVMAAEEFLWVSEEFSLIYNKVKDSVVGPTVFEDLSKQYSNEGSRLITKIITQITRSHKEEIRKLKNEVISEKGKARGELQLKESEYSDLVAKANTQQRGLKDEKKQMEEKLREIQFTQKNSGEQNKLVSKLQQENIELQTQISFLKAKLENYEMKQMDNIDKFDEFQASIRELLTEYSALKQTHIRLQDTFDHNVELQGFQKEANLKLLQLKKYHDSYDAEIKANFQNEVNAMKEHIHKLELQNSDFRKDLTLKETNVRVYKEKLKNKTLEDSLRDEQAQNVLRLTDLIMKFFERLEPRVTNQFRRELDSINQYASRLSNKRY